MFGLKQPVTTRLNVAYISLFLSLRKSTALQQLQFCLASVNFVRLVWLIQSDSQPDARCKFQNVRQESSFEAQKPNQDRNFFANADVQKRCFFDLQGLSNIVLMRKHRRSTRTVVDWKPFHKLRGIYFQLNFLPLLQIRQLLLILSSNPPKKTDFL